MPRRPVIRWRGWRPALWVLAVLGVGVDWFVTYVVGFVLLLTNAGVCSAPSTPAHLQATQRGFLLLLAVLALPWLAAAFCSRFPLRVAVFGATALALAVVWAMQTLLATPAEFTISWCLY